MSITVMSYVEMHCDRCGRPFTDNNGNVVTCDNDELSRFELVDNVLGAGWVSFNKLILCPECAKEQEQKK